MYGRYASCYSSAFSQLNSAIDPDQEYIYFIHSETLPSACYIPFNESRILDFRLYLITKNLPIRQALSR